MCKVCKVCKVDGLLTEFSAVATRVNIAPTSSTASERIWSIYDLIHTKRRNRLGAAKTTKLVSLYANASLQKSDEKDYIDILTHGGDDNDDASDDDGESEIDESDESDVRDVLREDESKSDSEEDFFEV